MQPTLCSRCKKNVAVIFITRLEGGQTKNEGLCLKCARELHIKPVDDVINKMGLSDDELDGLTNEMMEALGNADGLMDIENSDADSDADANPDGCADGHTDGCADSHACADPGARSENSDARKRGLHGKYGAGEPDSAYRRRHFRVRRGELQIRIRGRQSA